MPGANARLASRLAGIAAAGLAMLATLALRLEPATGGLIALAGLIVTFGVSALLGLRFGDDSGRAGFGAALFAPGFALAAGLPVPAILALTLLVLADAALFARLRPPALAPVMLAAALLAALAAVLVAGGASLVLVAAPVAPVTAIALRLGATNAATIGANAAIEIRPLLDLIARDGARDCLVCDLVGAVDDALTPGSGAGLAAAARAEGSLVSATLIADRVQVLDALSRAVHAGASSRDLMVRLRVERAGAGFPTPPRFEPARVSVDPLPGIEGRALVLVHPAQVADQPAPAASDADLTALRRAMHDCVAPFNAGLGFLDMLADPHLAPRDIAGYRDFAAEAHRAIAEAHRNTVMLGRLLDLARAPLGVAGPLSPERLVQDATRALSLRGALDRGQIRLAGFEAFPVATLEPTRARLAVEALLRHAMGHVSSEIIARREGRDLVLACIGRAGGEAAHVDDLQVEIEAAAMAGGFISFETDGEGHRLLRFVDAFAPGATAPEDAGEAGRAGLRLAS